MKRFASAVACLSLHFDFDGVRARAFADDDDLIPAVAQVNCAGVPRKASVCSAASKATG
ncbi:MAG: hypothetical protein ACJ74J_08600 [Blastocatellia bacterium]